MIAHGSKTQFAWRSVIENNASLRIGPITRLLYYIILYIILLLYSQIIKQSLKVVGNGFDDFF